MIMLEDILAVYLGSGVHPSLPATCPHTGASRIWEIRNWMRDVRLAGEKLLQERGIPVPPLRKIAPWSDLDEPTRIELDWYRSAKHLLIAAAVPTMEDLKKEWLEINPKRLVFVDHPVLGVPYPINTGYGPEVEAEARLFPAEGEDYWQWVGYIEEVGAEQLKIGGITRPHSAADRHTPGIHCYSLWWAVTWYEDLYCALTGTWPAKSLAVQDREMAATVRNMKEADKARAHEEDVATLLAVIERKNKEIADLKGLLVQIKAICG
jgi:hypothetical protein